MNKRVLCGALAVLISLFVLSGCQNTSTSSAPTSVGSSAISGDVSLASDVNSGNLSSGTAGSAAASEALSQPISTANNNYYVGGTIDGSVFDYPVEGATKTALVKCKSKSVELVYFYAGPNTKAPTLKVDGNLVAIDDCWGISSAQALDDIILLVVNAGGDVTSMNFYAIDTTGKVLLHVHNLDNNGMYLTHFGTDKDGNKYYRLQENQLLFQGTRINHASINTGTDAIELRDDNGKLTSDVDSIPTNEVIARQYTVNYLGEGKFGPITDGEITLTFGEYKKTLK